MLSYGSRVGGHLETDGTLHHLCSTNHPVLELLYELPWMEDPRHPYAASPPNLVLLYESHRMDIRSMQREGDDADGSLPDPASSIDLFTQLFTLRRGKAMTSLSEGLRLRLRSRRGAGDMIH